MPTLEKSSLGQTLSSKTSGLPSENPSGALKLPLSTVSAPSTLSLGDSFSTLPLGFSTVAFTLGHRNLKNEMRRVT